jgi:hypothetical protein
MIQDISGRLTKEFANCLQANMQAAGAPAAAPAADVSAAPAGTADKAPPVTVVTAKPVGGVRIALWAFWRSVVRFFKKLFGSSSGRRGGT